MFSSRKFQTLIRSGFAVVLPILLTALMTASSVKAQEQTLKVGDQAPVLKADKWLKGSPVESYSKENFYVLEFWATWCAPCIKSMPHLSEITEKYAKDGLKVVAVTTADEGNSFEAVQKFIEGRGSKYHFDYAFCENDTTYKAFMTAAGQNGIPCSFVVDRDGKIAYIGLPRDLDYVLSRVAAGKWRGKVDFDELEQMNNSVTKISEMAQTDPTKAAEMLAHIENAHPERAKGTDFVFAKVTVSCTNKKFDDAKATIEQNAEEFKRHDDQSTLAMLGGIFAAKDLNPDGVHRDFALSIIKEARAACADDWQSLLQVGISYRIAGESETCIECFKEALDKCPDEAVKQSLKATMLKLE